MDVGNILHKHTTHDSGEEMSYPYWFTNPFDVLTEQEKKEQEEYERIRAEQEATRH
jgi:hypothetical protein